MPVKADHAVKIDSYLSATLSFPFLLLAAPIFDLVQSLRNSINLWFIIIICDVHNIITTALASIKYTIIQSNNYTVYYIRIIFMY